jgi:hypothetical protein
MQTQNSNDKMISINMKFSILLLLLLLAVSSAAESYTVILKNGKIMKGHLLSETEELVVFKDEQGIQYSLKKSALDLQKMKEVNAPPPSEPVPANIPPPEEVQPTENTPQETQSKVEPQVITSPATEASTTSESEVTGSNPYLTSLREATGKLENTFDEVGSYLDAMMTAWEVNASTGRDPLAALREFKTNKATSLTVSIDASFQVLDKFKTELNNPPVQYTTAFDTFNSSIQTLTQYYDSVRQYEGKPAISVFRSRLNPTEQNIQKKIEELKAIKP